MRPHQLSLTEASEAISAGDLSPVELTDSVLARIEEVDGALGAFVTVTADAARRGAAAAEKEIVDGGHRGPLHGIPMGVKDLIDTAGVRTTASSAVRAGHVPATDATVVRRLAEAGAVLVGKTHTHEFAYGTTTPQTRNPHSPDHVVGGSSGGSAAAVAVGASTFALGTDTGGSIRIPAALTGVVGLKPTYGLVSRHGVASLSWSLDHVGPITRTVRDAGLVLNALAGPDEHDPATLAAAPQDALRLVGRDLTGVRVGVPADYYFDRVQPEVEQAVRAAIDVLVGLGATPVDIEIPLAHLVHAIQWGIMIPEASAYHQESLRAAPALYGADVRVLLEAGELFLATDYLRAQRVRTLLREAWSRLFRAVDVIAAPTVTSTAARRDQQVIEWPDGTVEPVSDSYVRLSAPANLTGLPSLSLPLGAAPPRLPIGMQLIGPALGEAMLIRVGAAYETVAATRVPVTP